MFYSLVIYERKSSRIIGGAIEKGSMAYEGIGWKGAKSRKASVKIIAQLC
jgi:hypothetical protein